MEKVNRRWMTTGGAVVLGLVALSVVLGSFYTVDEKERGVVLRNGAFIEVAEPGLHWKLPFFDTVKAISIQNQASKWEGLQAYSRDQQAAQLTVSVSWHVTPGEVADVYKGYSDLDGLLSRAIARQVPPRSTSTRTITGSAPSSRTTRTASIGEVPRVTVSSVITTLSPGCRAPARRPATPWSFASLRIVNERRSRPRVAATAAMP